MADSTRGFHAQLWRSLRHSHWWLASLLVHSLILGAPALIEEPELEAGAQHRARLVCPQMPPLREEIRPDFAEVEPSEEGEFLVDGPLVKEPVIAVDHDETDSELPVVDSVGFLSDSPFLGPSTNSAVGIGGGAGGSFGARGGSSSFRAYSFGSASELLVVEWDPERSNDPPTWNGWPLLGGRLFAQDASGDPFGECPLRMTNVRAEITAFLSRVELTQHFENPFRTKIHAVYVFPLPRKAAVSDFLLSIGDRTIRGVIREREEARQIYEEAKKAGLTASLVTQERPNIFVQEISNLEPGRPVDVTLTYLHPLRIRDGAFEFVFPMVVEPRYGGEARIAVPAPPPSRSGEGISIDIALEAGVEIESVDSPTHVIETETLSDDRVRVRLADRPLVANRDFVLRYRVDGDRANLGLLAHRAERGGFFAILATPKLDPMPEEIAPRELVFVLDCSGSMGGDPIEKSKAVVRHALAAIREGDTFRVLRFANQATGLSHRALPATSENIRRAVEFLDSLRAGGGTEGLTGIRAALNPPIEPGRHRIVCFLTDGIIGNEAQILAAVEDLRKGARLFSFGVGESVNRYLLDKLASRGRGAVQYVLPEMPADEAAERFCRRLRSPWLTDIDIDFGGLPVADIFPQRLPDLFPGAPLLVVGRYLGGGEGVLTVRGRRAGRLWERKISVKLPEWEERNEVLAPVWARCEIESVMDWLFQRPREARERITDLGLEFRLVTPFTSFIAADGSWTAGGAVRTVRIPIAMPDGVIYSGALGDRGEYCEIRPLGVLLEAAPRGMRVFRVREGSPAESAGVLEGDVLLTVNGTPVQNGREVRNATAIGPDRQNLRVRREGVRLVEVEFTSLDRERTEPR